MSYHIDCLYVLILYLLKKDNFKSIFSLARQCYVRRNLLIVFLLIIILGFEALHEVVRKLPNFLSIYTWLTLNVRLLAKYEAWGNLHLRVDYIIYILKMCAFGQYLIFSRWGIMMYEYCMNHSLKCFIRTLHLFQMYP